MLRRNMRCEDCRTPCAEEFKKIFDLQNSGLVIYRHKQKVSTVQSTSAEVLKNEYYILHNTNNCELKRPVFMFELSQYKTKCNLCKLNIQKVRSLLDEITGIKGKEVLSKCIYCKKTNLAGKCKRCEYIVNKFLTTKMKQCEERQNEYEQWLYKVRFLLKSLLVVTNACGCNINQENSITELEKLLNQLETPIHMRELDIRLFPDESDIVKVLSENKNTLQEIIYNLKNKIFSKRELSYNSLYVSPSSTPGYCICKNFVNINDQQDLASKTSPVHELVETMIESSSQSEPNNKVIKLKSYKEIQQKSPTKTKRLRIRKKLDELTKVKKGQSKENKENAMLDQQKKKSMKLSKHMNSEEQLLLKMMKKKGKAENELKNKHEKMKSLPELVGLPELKILSKHELIEGSSENVIVCGDQQPLYPIKMVKGNKIVSINFRKKSHSDDTTMPLLFEANTECAEVVSSTLPPQTHIGDNVKLKKYMSQYKNMNDDSTNGIICYQLSNKEFIDKGWTVLPVKKSMRRMNIYKMISAYPEFDWFERNKRKRMLFYATGEKLAEINDNGCGKWYYKNGVVALDYYQAKELNAGQRYVIYSSGDEYDNGKQMPTTVLASFDFLGNGVVYDHYGNIRLKYNQSEGVVIDEKIAPSGRWKWHTLNDPPVLKTVFINTYDNDRNSCVRVLLNENKEDPIENRAADPEILTIELENVAREKATKLLQKFKPFQIRMKVFKINKQFSLRIIDQSNIYVLFRDSQVSLKLNLGMLLLSDEIIDSKITEVSKVATPYDTHPPVSESMAFIQNTLSRAKKLGRRRGVPKLPPLILF